ncbi:SGNH/GDSL hydrolase family protein [Fundidesulfovibrio agrisoli]|uniref:SGNH/GDSL hydrolase family protein n=1 Tax=Fundidesulfovibrio agrisoli TaxID=2922717 RepID=UPI001FACC481|nr:GDSL-type esterase/lipase family protein [Fundidesulfovibrio agrisoli]
MSVAIFLAFIGSCLGLEVFALLHAQGEAPHGAPGAKPPAFDPQAFRVTCMPDPQLGYRLETRLPEAQGDVRAYAGRTVEARKKPDTVRIVCVGNSTTYGYSGPKTSYPALLQQMFDLALKGCPVQAEVINAGVVGYNSWHTRIRANTELEELSPDLYVVMDGVTDVLTAASISNVDEAVRQRGVLTRLVAMDTPEPDEGGSGKWPAWQPRSGPKDLFDLLGRAAMLREARLAVESWFTADAMEHKMKAFGFAENVAAFIRERQSRGTPVVVVNYGWIVRPDASAAKEADRIPYPVNVPLFKFGREYTRSVLRSAASASGAMFVDMQPWVDALTERHPEAFRLFLDETHYSQLLNYLLAREVFEKLRDSGFMRDRLGMCPVPSKESMDAALSYYAGWGEYYAGRDFAKPPALPLEIAEVEMRNLASTEESLAPQGWCKIAPQDPAKAGVMRGVLRLDGWKGPVYYHPRLFSNKGVVLVEAKLGGQWRKISETAQYDTGEWMPVGERYGFVPPNDAGDALEVRVTLSGSAQLFHHGADIFFRSQPAGR